MHFASPEKKLMKLELHRFFQRKEISNLATAIANTRVDGMKVRAKSFLKALAILSEENNYEDFLNSIEAKHQEAFSIARKEATFDYTKSREGKLVGIVIDVIITGNWTQTVSIHDEIIGDDGYLDKCIVRGLVDGGRSNNSDVSIEKTLEYTQITLNYLFGIANWINTNKKTLTPPDFDSSWCINAFGEYKPSKIN